MDIASLHTHNVFCDGTTEIEAMLLAAQSAGLSGFGASSHAPVPWQTHYAIPLNEVPLYVADVLGLQEKYSGRIDVYLGLELDYTPALVDYYRTHLAQYPFDYLIGSVHYVGEIGGQPWCFEASEKEFVRGLEQRHGGNVRHVVEHYYRLVAEVARLPEVAIVGHLDRIKLFNVDGRFFDEAAPWYRDAVEGALQVVKDAGKVVELNTAGWRRPIDSPFPSASIVRRCAELGIPMVLTSDAHTPEQIADHFDQGAELMRAAGYTHSVTLRGGEWTPVPLE